MTRQSPLFFPIFARTRPRFLGLNDNRGGRPPRSKDAVVRPVLLEPLAMELDVVLLVPVFSSRVFHVRLVIGL
jgi:hypothetical protein